MHAISIFDQNQDSHFTYFHIQRQHFNKYVLYEVFKSEFYVAWFEQRTRPTSVSSANFIRLCQVDRKDYPTFSTLSYIEGRSAERKLGQVCWLSLWRWIESAAKAQARGKADDWATGIVLSNSFHTGAHLPT